MQYLVRAAVSAVLLAVGVPATWGAEVGKRFEINGIVAPTVQCQKLSAPPGGAGADPDDCRSAIPAQFELSLRPGDAGELFVKLGIAGGNGLNDRTPLLLSPWAADLEDDLKDINGRDRDHLLAAWYRHSHAMGHAGLAVTAGIIDATDYLDENAYANDEYSQFMNEALVNGPNAFLPSYDAGVALELDRGPLSLKAVVMDVGTNDNGSSFQFYGAQIGYTKESNGRSQEHRVVVAKTSHDFLHRTRAHVKEDLLAVLYSGDWTADSVGFWVRSGWQDDAGAVDYQWLYSGGLYLDGKRWGRAGDGVGVGAAYLSGGNQDVDRVYVVEGYYRWALGGDLHLTLDLQYQDGKRVGGADRRGWVLGLRSTAAF